MIVNAINNEIIDNVHITQVLANMKVGFWSIENPSHGAPKMYGDTTMHTVLGIETDKLNPEVLYLYWMENIDPKYIEIVIQTVEFIKSGKTSEVKYLWRHPKKGWIWVRCGGYLDETYTEGVRFKGWHYDITNELESDIIDSRHTIADSQKLKLYAPYVIGNIEELYEIDCADLAVHTIFCEKNKYRKIKDGKNVLLVIREQVHPDHIDLLNNIFKPASLREIVIQKCSRQIECKIKTTSEEYCWVEAKVFPVNAAGRDKLLFCISDISDRKKAAELSNEKNEILDALYNMYSAIAEIDFSTKDAYILKGTENFFRQKVLPVEQLYHTIISCYSVSSEKDTMKYFFDIDNLKLIAEKQENVGMDFQVAESGKHSKWKRIDILCVPGNKAKLYLAICDIDEKHVMDSIIKHFVFSNSDYLYYIDLKNNSFINFCKNEENILLPPQHGDDYVRAMTEYNKRYLALEDQDRATELMQPDYMIRRLQNEDSYKIEAGIIDDKGNYRRKEVAIQGYDPKSQTVFMIRKDITKEYIRQKKQKETLETAHKIANTDILTSLYNRKGACSEIEKRLLKIKDEMDAFIIIDLDNFKSVNDSLGHLRGDELLQKVAKTLEENFRKTDIIARLGGDEFIIYMKDVRSRKTVANTMEKLIGRLQFSYPVENGNVNVSASVGIAVVPMDGMCFEDLYIKSDKALYDSKRRGKNRYSFFMENEE